MSVSPASKSPPMIADATAEPLVAVLIVTLMPCRAKKPRSCA
jgi:iron only hydrogenase large subunit-like protein